MRLILALKTAIKNPFRNQCHGKYYIRAKAINLKQVYEEVAMDQDFRGGLYNRIGFAAILAAFVCIAVSFLLISTAALLAAEEQEVPEEFLIENKVYKTDRKGPVRFSHLEHAEGYVESCDQCHHEYKDGKNIWEEGQPVKKCAECHDPSKSVGKVKKLNLAYHKNCKTCHRELAKEGSTEAPYKQCTDCHAKKGK